jgi:hypothetical protein
VIACELGLVPINACITVLGLPPHLNVNDFLGILIVTTGFLFSEHVLGRRWIDKHLTHRGLLSSVAVKYVFKITLLVVVMISLSPPFSQQHRIFSTLSKGLHLHVIFILLKI